MATQKDDIRNNEVSTNLGQAGEPLVAYCQSPSQVKVSQLMTQKEINAECLSLEESKNRLVEKIKSHYHQ